MNEHLSPEQIARWMLGERAADEERHVSACAKCGAETGRLQEALSLYRGSVRQWSAAESSAPPQMDWTAARPRRQLRWAFAAAVVALAAVPVWTNLSGERNRTLSSKSARAEVTDAALLDQVDAGISQAVPAPMEPLAALEARAAAQATPAGTADNTRKVQ